jgi:phospholipid-hydroperoxide glutathione peroxidase
MIRITKMNVITILFTTALITGKAEMSDDDNWKKANSVYDFTVNAINGEPVSLEKYKGNVLLIVNVASNCTLAATNYDQLVELDEKYRDKGLRILAFPSNQFAGQEPGGSDEILAFVKSKKVNFDMFEKIDVNGDNAHPLFKYLKMKLPGTFGINFIKWNFTKFIVDKEGNPVERHSPLTKPLSLASNIEKYLQQ